MKRLGLFAIFISLWLTSLAPLQAQGSSEELLTDNGWPSLTEQSEYRREIQDCISNFTSDCEYYLADLPMFFGDEDLYWLRYDALKIGCDNDYTLSCKIAGLVGLIAPKTLETSEYQMTALSKACQAQESHTCNSLALAYMLGRGRVIDWDKSKAVYENLCASDPSQCFNKQTFDEALQQMEDLRNNPDLVEQIIINCETDISYSCFLAGRMLSSGVALPLDLPRSETFFRRDCEAKNMNGLGCARLGDFYRYGLNGVIDKDQALNFYRLGCTKGDNTTCEIGASYNLDLLKITGDYRNVESVGAVGLDDRCDWGFYDACLQVAIEYQDGYWRDQDLTKSRTILDTA
ncbi:MAG: hypothetical protein AAFR74_06980, partial [Pseudomonadota bacterium]